MWSQALTTITAVIWCLIGASEAIINRPPASSSPNRGGSIYLNSQRPLWILEDQVQRQPDVESITFTTTRRPYYQQPYYQYKRSRNPPMRRPFQLPHGIPLPNHYMSSVQRVHKPQPPQRRDFRNPRQHIPVRRQNHATESTHMLMPTFDNLPGEDTGEAMPIFIYNGPKGELILNTMMSTRKYPMQEPVPGQVLYPPTAPIFRPKPIVERFRVPGSSQTLNLTLIPFYAHEAISLNARTFEQDMPLPQSTPNDDIITSPATPPSVLYAAPRSESMTPKPSKKRHFKKSKQYSAYRSPNDVQWLPTPAALKLATQAPTTPFPLTLASPLQNHRYAADFDAPTTPKPFNNFKLTYKDEGDQFQIVYVDESLEKPTATPTHSSSLQNARYSLANEYYAFPVFTLGKLLKPDADKPLNYLTEHSTMLVDMYDGEERNTEKATTETQSSDTTTAESDKTDTWFILNSRYKGHHNHNDEYRLSSRYVQNAMPGGQNFNGLNDQRTAPVDVNEFLA